MWSALIFVSLIWWAAAQAQGGRRSRQSDPHGWDIRLAVPGEPGADYPTLGSIPRTSFSCAGKEPGYYADLETNCQVFRVCTSGSTYGFQSFLCPNGTLFNQAVFVCDWWMNVNCERSQELFTSNNEKFGNLKLGPQLMKDIKKMLTHPMRNPYDKTVTKSNLIVMQDYKPPNGQMFGALLAGPERPNNLYAPAKLVQGYQNSFSNNAIAASTASSQYVPPPFNTLPTQSDAEIFQRQRQNAQQFGRLQQAPPSGHISNGHTRQYAQKQVIFSNNNVNSVTRPQQTYNQIQSQKQTNYATQTFQRNVANSQRGQLNRQNAQYTLPAQSAKQRGYEAQYSKQQYNYPAPAEQTYSTNDNTGHINTEARQNLALVFSFLADSLNAAKEYSNLAQQNTQTQYQTVNNEDISQLTNQVSQLTAAQYSNYNQNQNHANIVSTQTTNTDQYRPAKYTNFQQNQPQQQSAQINSAHPQSDQGVHPARVQNGEISANVQSNSQIYSGQLYQLPVPDVTNQIYNAEPARIVQGRQQTEAEHLHEGHNNKQSAEVEIIRSESVPVRPAKLQQAPNEEAFSSQEQSTQALNFINRGDGIATEVRDKIVGTIPHPSQENKVVTYKKDQSYFLYTKLDSANGNVQNVAQRQSAKLIQNPNVQNVVTFQLVPSVSYQLEDEKDQQKILNTFNIDQYGNPKGQGHELASNVDYSVDHSSAKQVLGQLNDVNTIYTGPSSYSAPQESVGNLGSQRNTQNNNLSSRLEQFDEQNNNIGYGKETPGRPFSF